MTHAFIGRMVLYRLTAEDALATNKRREDAAGNVEKMREERPGFQAHVGTALVEGQRAPMVITFAGNAGDTFPHGLSAPFVNGQVLLDGNDSLWVTGVHEGDEPGQWQPITDA